MGAAPQHRSLMGVQPRCTEQPLLFPGGWGGALEPFHQLPPHFTDEEPEAQRRCFVKVTRLPAADLV